MKKILMIAAILVLASTAVFANGQMDEVTGYLTSTVQNVLYVEDFTQVPSTDEINRYFTEAGIDLKYINAELADIPDDIVDEIDEVIEDNDLGDLAKAEVKDWVQNGRAEDAYMYLGQQVYLFETED